MDQPEGCVVAGQENKVYKLMKSLYGLKDALKQCSEISKVVDINLPAIVLEHMHKTINVKDGKHRMGVCRRKIR